MNVDIIKDENFLFEQSAILIFVILPLNLWKTWKKIWTTFQNYNTLFNRMKLLHFVRQHKLCRISQTSYNKRKVPLLSVILYI